MNFHVLTLFPEIVNNSLNHSIIGRAISNDIININTINMRDFATNKHKQVDDYPYGGGAGMVISAEPVYNSFLSIKDNLSKDTPVINLTPAGKVFDQQIAQDLSEKKDVVFLCGHYEGIDQRVLDEIVTEEISLGDFILTGGEMAAIVIIDSVSRLISGVLGKEESFMEESFSNGLLEYPQYTRPNSFLGTTVPDILLSGHHKNIENWRKEQSIITTMKKRPDLIEKILTDEISYDKQLIDAIKKIAADNC